MDVTFFIFGRSFTSRSQNFDVLSSTFCGRKYGRLVVIQNHVCLEHCSLQLVVLYLPDVLHAAHRLEGNTGSRSLQESLVNGRRVVEHGGADHSESHCSNINLRMIKSLRHSNSETSSFPSTCLR